MVDESHTNKTIQEAAKMASSLLAINKITRKRSREKLISNDQIDTFHERYIFTSLADLNKTTAPYNLVFDEGTKFPKTLESLKVDLNFHFQ